MAKTKITEDMHEEIWKAIAAGESYITIGERFGVQRVAVSRFATLRGYRKYRRSVSDTMKAMQELFIERPELLEDRAALRVEVSKILGYEATRQRVNNLVKAMGLTRRKFKVEDLQEAIKKGLGVDAFGLPSYGEQADKAMFELIETDDPPQWLVDAYEPWLEGRRDGIRALRRSEQSEGDQRPDVGDDCGYDWIEWEWE